MVWSLSSLIIGLIVGGLIGYAMASARAVQDGAQAGGQKNSRLKASSAFSSETGTIGETSPAQQYGQDPGKLAATSALVFVKNKNQDICGCDATQATHQEATEQNQSYNQQNDQNQR